MSDETRDHMVTVALTIEVEDSTDEDVQAYVAALAGEDINVRLKDGANAGKLWGGTVQTAVLASDVPAL